VLLLGRFEKGSSFYDVAQYEVTKKAITINNAPGDYFNALSIEKV
jgi:hypothetical protein